MQDKIFTDEKTGLQYLLENNGAKTAYFVFHGYGASMFDLFSLSEVGSNALAFDWYFPNAPIELMPGSLMARAWFPIDAQGLEEAMLKGEHREFSDLCPSEFLESLKLLESFISQYKDKYENIILAGFSQGAMLATHLSFTTELNPKALICFSGAPIASERLEKANKNIPFFQSHGENDPILSFKESRDLFELLKLGGAHPCEFVSFPGAHEIPMKVLKKWDEFNLKLN